MSVLDVLAFGIPIPAGLLLLFHFFCRADRWRTIPRIPAGVVAVHRLAQSRLVEGKMFPIPGARLVSSLRGWAAGEILWFSVTAAALASNPTVRTFLSSAVIGAGLGGMVVYQSIRDQARKQLGSIRSTLPVAAFLLSLLLEAGMGSHSALQEVSHAIPKGPLAEELKEISRSRSIGIPREEALERSRKRVPLEDYHVFLNLIRQGERLGVGLSRGLREHSSNMLEGDGHRAEATAQKAAVKLLFPLVAFIFPAVALVIFSPVLLHLWDLWGAPA